MFRDGLDLDINTVGYWAHFDKPSNNWCKLRSMDPLVRPVLVLKAVLISGA